jgi:hypothetical protein
MTQAQQNMGMEMIGVLTKNNDNNTKMLKKKKTITCTWLGVT